MVTILHCLIESLSLDFPFIRNRNWTTYRLWRATREMSLILSEPTTLSPRPRRPELLFVGDSLFSFSFN